MNPQRTDTFLDNTKISAYKDCPRKYFLRHVMNWRGEGIAMPLAFGGAWHAALDVVWKLGNKQLDTRDLTQAAMSGFFDKWIEEGLPGEPNMEQLTMMTPRTPGIAAEMLYNYIEIRKNYLRDAEVLSIEQPFAVPMPSIPHTWYVGRLDKVLQYQGQTIVLEHKTTSLYRKEGNFETNWVDSWNVDSQVIGYEFGAGLYYPSIDGVWIDAALCHKTVHNGFKIIPIKHTVDIIAEWLGDTEQWVERINKDEILFAQYSHLTKGVFPKNTNSCFGKYGACSYLDVCRTTSDVRKGQEPPFGYVVEEWSPFETLGLETIVNN
jgi:hypothetical protein